MLYNIPCRIYILSTLSLCISGIVSTATATSSETKISNEETLVVTTNRSASNLWESPATIQVIDQQTLQNSTNASIADNLQDIPGVEITDNSLAGRKQIRIRGEASSRVLILIDGQEVTYQRAGDNYGVGLLIDESALERVEVVKGPYSVLYGSQAIGGIVNFITKKGGDKLASGVVKAVYNSATAGWEESIAVQGSIGGFDYRINGSYSDQGNRDTPDGRLPNTNYRNNSQGVWLGYNSGNHRFGLSLDRYRLATQTYYEDPDGSYEAFSVKIPKLEREKVGVFYDTDVDGDYLKKIHFDAYEQTIQRQFANEVKTTQPVPSPMIQALTVHNKTDTHDKQYTQAVTLQSHFSLPANNELVTGAQYKQDRVSQRSGGMTSSKSLTGFINKETRTRSYYESEQSTVSLFAQNDWQFADHWTWTMGVRQYWLSSKLTRGDGVSYTAGIISDTSLARESASDHEMVTSTSLRYSGFDNLELRAAFAQGYVFPTLSQLFMQTSAGGSVTYGNPDLKAEHSNNFELGARYNGNQSGLWGKISQWSGINNQGREDYRKRDFAPDSPEIKFSDRREALELMTQIESTVTSLHREAEAQFRPELEKIVSGIETGFRGTALYATENIAGRINARLEDEGFTVKISFPAVSQLQTRLAVKINLSALMEERTETVTRRRRQSGVWGTVCRWFGTSDLGWENYDEDVSRSVININKVREEVMSLTRAYFGELQASIEQDINQPVRQEIDAFFCAFREKVEQLRNTLIQSSEDHKRDQQAQERLTGRLQALNERVPELITDSKALREELETML
ncbi:TPA: TonB-dependent receptor [Escherichia coli]|nr:TonB-dependent receptor [Escherichia coli]HAP0745379.1 TonB-dependent receptor [Escherichia coli]